MHLNWFHDFIFRSVYEGLLKLKQLERLSVGCLAACDCVDIVRVIAGLQNLKELAISGNPTSEIENGEWSHFFNCPLIENSPFKANLIQTFTKQPQLVRFCTRDLLHFSTKDYQSLAMALPNLEEFEIEELSGNSINMLDIIELVRFASKLKVITIHELFFKFNQKFHHDLEMLIERRQNQRNLIVKVYRGCALFTPPTMSLVQVETFWMN